MKFGVREAVNVVFKATAPMTLGKTSIEKGEPVLYFDTVKTSTTEGSATTVYAQGGYGNPRLIAWEGDKAITFTFEDALISAEGMSILTGAGLIDPTNEEIRVHRKAVVQVQTAEDGSVTVDLTNEIPGNGTLVDTGDIFGFILDGSNEISERLGVGTGKVGAIKFTKKASEGLHSQTVNVLVDFYVKMNSGVKELTITPEKFAGYFYIEGETLFRRQSDGVDLPAQIIIPNAKIQTSFNFNMSPEGDPSTFSFAADAFPGVIKGKTGVNAHKSMYAIQIIEDMQAPAAGSPETGLGG